MYIEFEGSLTKEDYLDLHRFQHRSPIIKVLCWIFYLGLPALLTWVATQLLRGDLVSNVLAIAMIPGAVLLILLFVVRATRSKWHKLSQEQKALKGWVAENGAGWVSEETGCTFSAWSAYKLYELSESKILFAGPYAAPCILPKSMFSDSDWLNIAQLIKENVVEVSEPQSQHAVVEPPKDQNDIPLGYADLLGQETIATSDGVLKGADVCAANYSRNQSSSKGQRNGKTQRNGWKKYLRIVLWPLALAPFVAIFLRDVKLIADSPLFYSSITVVLFFISLYCFFSWQMKRAQRGVGFKDSPVKIYFKPSGLISCSAHGYAIRCWDQFSTYLETPDVLVLFLKNNRMQVIPHSHFASDSDFEKARDVIQGNLPDISTYRDKQVLAEMGLR